MHECLLATHIPTGWITHFLIFTISLRTIECSDFSDEYKASQRHVPNHFRRDPSSHRTFSALKYSPNPLHWVDCFASPREVIINVFLPKYGLYEMYFPDFMTWIHTGVNVRQGDVAVNYCIFQSIGISACCGCPIVSFEWNSGIGRFRAFFCV